MSSTKQHHFRKGDWMCSKCSNINFSFRHVCNRCTEERYQQGFQSALYVSMNQNLEEHSKAYETPGLLPSIEPLMKIINEQKSSVETFQFVWKCDSCDVQNQYYKRECVECGAKKDQLT